MYMYIVRAGSCFACASQMTLSPYLFVIAYICSSSSSNSSRWRRDATVRMPVGNLQFPVLFYTRASKPSDTMTLSLSVFYFFFFLYLRLSFRRLYTPAPAIPASLVRVLILGARVTLYLVPRLTTLPLLLLQIFFFFLFLP